ncbi:MAG: hypothetical protein ACK4K2_03905 [Dehalococcoidia bacterium]
MTPERKRGVLQTLADALHQARERMERASTPQETQALQRMLEDVLAWVEDQVILTYERGKKEITVLQAVGEMLAYALEMVVEGDRDKALRTLDRALAMLAPFEPDTVASPRKGGIRYASSPRGLPHH